MTAIRQTRRFLAAAVAKMSRDDGAEPRATICVPCDSLVIVAHGDPVPAACATCDATLDALPARAALDAMTRGARGRA